MPTRRHVTALLGGAMGALASTRLAAVAAPRPFRVVGFAGASNLPFWIAGDKGFFTREGLAPTFAVTPNSVQMAQDLAAKTFDLALTSIDNVVAYDEGQGEAAMRSAPDFVALFGIDDGMLSVMGAPGLASIASLKGKTVSVDAMTTGFAFVLREVLKGAGLSVDEVKWVKAGGGAQRLEALLKGEEDATLLNAPLDLAAEAKGFVRLADARDVIGPYQGIVGMTRRADIPAMRLQIEGFIRAFHAAVAWAYEPANRAEAVAILLARQKGMAPEAAQRAVARLLEPGRGIFRDLRIRPEGVATVLRLRSAYAMPAKALSDPASYIDESVLVSALKG